MAKIIRARFDEIVPTSPVVSQRGINRVYKRVIKPRFLLFPIPARTSKNFPDMYIPLDPGNSRIIYTMMNWQFTVPLLVVESRNDRVSPYKFIPSLEVSVKNANHAISENWAESEKMAIKLTSRNVPNFENYFERLVKKYPYFSSIPGFLGHREDARDTGDAAYSPISIF